MQCLFQAIRTNYMGKGAGCGSSKTVQDEHKQSQAAGVSKQQPPIAQPVTSTAPASQTKTPATMSTTGTKKIYVVFYTTYGHIYKLVQEVAKGINAVPGTEAVLLQVGTPLIFPVWALELQIIAIADELYLML